LFGILQVAEYRRELKARFVAMVIKVSVEELREALLHHIPDALYHDDVHGKPAWRKHMTLRLAEEIRAELQGLL